MAVVNEKFKTEDEILGDIIKELKKIEEVKISKKEITETSNDSYPAQPISINSKQIKDNFNIFRTQLGRLLGCARARGFINKLVSKGMSKVRKEIESFVKNPTVSKFDSCVLNLDDVILNCSERSKLKKIAGEWENLNISKMIIYKVVDKIKEDNIKNKVIAWVSNNRNITNLNKFQTAVKNAPANDFPEDTGLEFQINLVLKNSANNIEEQAKETYKKLKGK